jgi:myo-inositol-1(or 4)-monophosphatase
MPASPHPSGSSSHARYSRACSAAERREFEPFMHRLIGIAFAAIRPLFLSGTAVIAKADATPVTQADRGAEQALRAAIERAYPEHAIIGEEFGVKPGRGYRWTLDPVDGTRAFITHCFLFGTLIALERDDGDGFRPILGAIAHPAAGVALIGHGEETRLYAQDGSQRRAAARPCPDLAQATVLASTHWTSAEQGAHGEIKRVARRAKMYRTWGDCFGYFALATGGADVMLDPQLAYWDVAAIVPVVEGAGGRVTHWQGGDPLLAPSLIATAGPLHDEVLRLLGAPV